MTRGTPSVNTAGRWSLVLREMLSPYHNTLVAKHLKGASHTSAGLNGLFPACSMSTLAGHDRCNTNLACTTAGCTCQNKRSKTAASIKSYTNVIATSRDPTSCLKRVLCRSSLQWAGFIASPLFKFGVGRIEKI